MSVKWRQSEICIVINDTTQDSIAKHLGSDGLLYYKFITQFANKIFFLNRRTSGEVTGKMVDCVICIILLTSFVVEDAEFAR